jgi:hypothetical protein
LATLERLGLKGDDQDTFTIRYYGIRPAQALPTGASAIGRVRSKNGKDAEVTVKYRLAAGDPTRLAWNCPLPSAKSKSEMDISLLSRGEVKRTMSYSCEAKMKQPVFPTPLQATATGCEVQMVRYRAGSVKVEEWRIPGKPLLIEISQGGLDAPDDLKKFEQLVAPLISAGAVAVDRSKTEAGSNCTP